MDAACPVETGVNSTPANRPSPPVSIDFDRYAERGENGTFRLEVTVPDIHCPACIKRIEEGLKAHPAVQEARVNMSTKRVRIAWAGDTVSANDLAKALIDMGYDVFPFEAASTAQAAEDRYGRELLLSLALSGFAAGNLMMLSVSVWSGAEGATRDLFHWISALIALPVILIAGRPFYRSALKALKARRLNMDVPISLAVLLAGGISLFETFKSGAVTYFDAAVMLLFFLLIGRYLDHMMRERARSAVAGLLSLTPRYSEIVTANGERQRMAVADITPGMVVAIAAGERVPIDGTVQSGESEIDCAHITGETRPELARPGTKLLAGSLNLSSPLLVRVDKPAADSFIADMVRLMEAAEQGKASYMRLADRAAAIYAPVVHLLALATFLGWLAFGAGWQPSLLIAISVLIITCPCALGLAVPAVQVVASGQLFRHHVMVKDGTALEKLAEIDTVVFDKTGTLTLGRPQLLPDPSFSDRDLAIAAGAAAHSRHPLSQALVKAATARGLVPAPVTALSETPGRGLEGQFEGQPLRLGAPDFVDPEGGRNTHGGPSADKALSAETLQVWLKIGTSPTIVFQFEDALRPGARDAVNKLKARGLELHILSGDRTAPVAKVAATLGIAHFRAALSPADKVAAVTQMRQNGRKVLMVGDGLNDAPALAAGHVSMAPAEASDVGRAAASFVFIGEDLQAVPGTHRIAKVARRLVTQNFALAVLYNMIAVPIAVAGYASPLVAAIAMSSSSILVTLNALRLRLFRFQG